MAEYSTERLTLHFNEMLHLLAIAEERRQTLNIKAWKSAGEVVLYKGWVVHHDHWRGGYVIIRNPINNQLRTIPQIFIFEVNDKRVYL